MGRCGFAYQYMHNFVKGWVDDSPIWMDGWCAVEVLNRLRDEWMVAGSGKAYGQRTREQRK